MYFFVSPVGVECRFPPLGQHLISGGPMEDVVDVYLEIFIVSSIDETAIVIPVLSGLVRGSRGTQVHGDRF